MSNVSLIMVEKMSDTDVKVQICHSFHHGQSNDTLANAMPHSCDLLVSSTGIKHAQGDFIHRTEQFHCKGECPGPVMGIRRFYERVDLLLGFLPGNGLVWLQL